MTDSTEDIKCPLCGKNMKKFFLKSAGCNVDICLDGCGGLYFDNYELKKIEKNEIDVSSLVEILKDKQFEKIDSSELIKCPVCQSNMVQHYTTPSKRNSVEECYRCGGTFIMSDIFLSMMEELKLPKEKRENINDYLSSYLTPAMLEEMKRERVPYESRTVLKKVFDSFMK